MKNISKVTGLVLIAIAGLLCAACGGGAGGSGGIPVLVRTAGGQGRSIGRAAGDGRGGLVRAPVGEDPNFDELNDLYEDIGTKADSVTPDKFTAGWFINVVLSDGHKEGIGAGLFDFTKPLTIQIGEVPTGITVSALEINFTPQIGEFKKPQDMEEATVSKIGDSTLNGNTITTSLGYFTTWYETGDPQYITLSSFVCYGNERKLVNGLITGPGGSEFGMHSGNQYRNMVMPFTPVNIPEGASSVTLDVSWDLEEIIEWWTGEDGNKNTDDDKFVFKKGWWNNLNITASVQ